MKRNLAPAALSLAVSLALLLPSAARPQIEVSVNFGPPPLPYYVQPPVPAPGYLWTPGYWGWNPQDGGYFWVPGTWVRAPSPGALWTPGYWAFHSGGYRWNTGYWGPTVGFYGGINYGFGYTGSGYYGGRWDRGVFHYNQDVNNVNRTVVHNVYNTKVVNNYNVTQVSYNGGPQGVRAQPNAEQREQRDARHTAPTPNQREHERMAMKEPQQRAKVNQGQPPLAATQKPADFKAAGPRRETDDAPGRAAKHDGIEPASPPRMPAQVPPAVTPQEPGKPPPKAHAQGNATHGQPQGQAQPQPQPQPQPQQQQQVQPQPQPQPQQGAGQGHKNPKARDEQ